MADVKLIKDQPLGSLPQTWSLVRVGTGPGRGEGTGFRSVKEAEDFARQYGHVIVERENGMLNGLSRGSARYGGGAHP